MAKVTCNIVKDLLPLYVDGVISEDSGKLVEEHLESCSECKDYYNQLKDADIPVGKAADDKATIKKIRRRLNLKKIIVGCIVAAVVAAGAFGAYYKYVLDESYMSYEESGVYLENDVLKTKNNYYCLYGFDAPGNEIEFIILTTTPYESGRNKGKETTEIRDFKVVNETHIEHDGIVETYETKQVYYVPIEYAEKLMANEYWADNEDDTEEGFKKANQQKLDELISVSTLLWERK